MFKKRKSLKANTLNALGTGSILPVNPSGRGIRFRSDDFMDTFSFAGHGCLAWRQSPVPALLRPEETTNAEIKNKKDCKVFAVDIKKIDASFYEDCRSYAERKGYGQEIVEDFPSWAFIRISEGSRSRIDQLFVDFLRLNLGASESGKSLRKELRLAGGNELEYDLALDCVELPGEALEREQLWEMVPEKDRKILKLYFAEGLTKKEIGELLGVSEARISQRMSASLKELKGILFE